MKKPIYQFFSLALLALIITSLSFKVKKVDSIQVKSDKYVDVSGFEHMKVEVQNDFNCSKQGVHWSLFGDLPVIEVDWKLTGQNDGQIHYTILSQEMEGEVRVNLSENEIELKLITRDYGQINWVLSIDEVDTRYSN